MALKLKIQMSSALQCFCSEDCVRDMLLSLIAEKIVKYFKCSTLACSLTFLWLTGLALLAGEGALHVKSRYYLVLTFAAYRWRAKGNSNMEIAMRNIPL